MFERRSLGQPILRKSKLSTRPLRELLPELPPEIIEEFRERQQASAAAEHAGWLMIAQELDEGPLIN